MLGPLRRRGDRPGEPVLAGRPDAGAAPGAQAGRRPPKASWKLERGAPIGDGRTVLSRLGGGRRCEVYLVRDARLDAMLVAKVLRPDQVDDARALKALAREAEALERLAHPGLVRGFGAVLDGPHPHVALEYLEGPTLRAQIKREGRLPLEAVLPLGLALAAAVHHLATQRTVHLDIKPGNIVMAAPARLIDLSIARTFARAARLTGSLGTDAYMAPEQCGRERFRGLIGPASDVFGLGATLFHAIAGEVPFPRPQGARHSADPLVRWPQLEVDPRPLPADTPRPLAEVIEHSLRRDPAERPVAIDVAAALEPLLARPTRLPRAGSRAATG